MKKFLMASAFAFLAVGSVNADLRGTPKGSPQGLSSADYGGVSIATVTFSSSNVLLFGKAGGSISFIHVATANAAPLLTDHIIVRSTYGTSTPLIAGKISGGYAGNGDYSTGNELYRIYVGTSVGTSGGYQNQWVSNGITGFDYVFPSPIFIPAYGMVKLSGISFGPVTIGYTKFE